MYSGHKYNARRYYSRVSRTAPDPLFHSFDLTEPPVNPNTDFQLFPDIQLFPDNAFDDMSIAVSGLEMAQNSARLSWTAEEVDRVDVDI
ncbi:hypothetical protein VTN77DRAFT_3598 [Rasamsonia byssochlamydoides]|uniref:uncharacterized protein n=1 Tax=Rasamsonia byssochlamydoides TaxID=89139 RepID=UPI003743728F